MRKKTSSLLSWVLATTILLHASPARTAFHLVVIDEVFFGTADCPDAQYVELRMIAFGQVFVSGQRVTTQAADGTAAADFGRFMTTLSNGQSGAKMILGTAEAAGLFGMTFDGVVSGRLVQPDGRLCFATGPVDCIAYGNFTGNNSGYGSPAAAPVPGMALLRRSETDDNAADFVLGAPNPENNAGVVGTLGQCPGADPTATATIPAPTPTSTVEACTGDCNRDLTVTVDEVIRGVNLALGTGSLDGCPEFDADGSGSVTVDEVVAAVNNGLNGC